MEKPQNPIVEKLRKPLLYAVIGLFGLSALLGIFFILASPDQMGSRVIATTTLLAFFALFSLNNINRLNASGAPKTLSIIALISNVFWCLPWLLTVWDIFAWTMCTRQYFSYHPEIEGLYSYSCTNTYYDFMQIMYKVIWLAASISFATTFSANFLKLKNYNTAIRALKNTAIASITFIVIYITPAILWETWSYASDSWQLIAISGILFAFSAITTPILHSVSKRKAKEIAQQHDMNAQIAAEKQKVSDDMANIRAELEDKIRKEIEAEIEAKTSARSDIQATPKSSKLDKNR